MLKPATRDDLMDVQRAIIALRHARHLLVNSPKARAKVLIALKSAEGAERHMLRRWNSTRGEEV